MGGYSGTGPDAGTFVPEDVAFEYALWRCIMGTPEDKKDFREMLVEWFCSGNWVREEG